jgi:hypothetical protein
VPLAGALQGSGGGGVVHGRVRDTSTGPDESHASRATRTYAYEQSEALHALQEALEASHSPLFDVISLLPVATAELHPLYSQHIFKISPEQTQRYRSF